MFVDIGLLVRFDFISELAAHLVGHDQGLFLSAVLLSQFISNVPAAILLESYTTNWQILAWGVSVGGFGLAIGSLANIIDLRLAGEKKLWKEFHFWSVPILIISVLLVYLVV